MNTCLALQLIAFSGCDHLGTEKGSYDIYVIIFIPLVWVTVLFPWHFQVLFPFTDFLSSLGQVVWSWIFKGLAHVYTILMVGVEGTGIRLSLSLWFSLPILVWTS